ncbi:MAG: hypothetical protein ACRD6X_08880 [Pyrinomonadaceae bacterium]
MKIEERVDRVENAIVIIKDLLLRHDERMDNFDLGMRQSREEFEFKMNALIDSQIKTEAEIIGLKELTAKLSSASISQVERIEKLEER